MNDANKKCHEDLEVMLRNISKEKIEPPKELLEVTIKKCKASREKENYTIIIMVVLCSILSTVSLGIALFKLSILMKITAISIWAMFNNGLAFILFYNRKELFKELFTEKGVDI